MIATKTARATTAILLHFGDFVSDMVRPTWNAQGSALTDLRHRCVLPLTAGSWRPLRLPCPAVQPQTLRPFLRRAQPRCSAWIGASKVSASAPSGPFTSRKPTSHAQKGHLVITGRGPPRSRPISSAGIRPSSAPWPAMLRLRCRASKSRRALSSDNHANLPVALLCLTAAFSSRVRQQRQITGWQDRDSSRIG